jgi:hypothetical protein
MTNLNGSTPAGHQKLRPEDLYGLEQYAKQRAQFRTQVLAHKKRRSLQVGPNATFCFEDRLTVQYQVQEMLRIERIFEAAGIGDELGAYNPLIPDGSNWKATLLIEYPDPDVRKAALAKLKGVEDRCWVQVAGHERVYAIADEDLDRENEERPRRCTSCASNSPRPWSPKRSEVQRSASAWTTITIDTRSSRSRTRSARRSSRISPEITVP